MEKPLSEIRGEATTTWQRFAGMAKSILRSTGFAEDKAGPLNVVQEVGRGPLQPTFDSIDPLGDARRLSVARKRLEIVLGPPPN